MASSFKESFDERNDELTVDNERKDHRDKRVNDLSVKVPQFSFRLGRQPIALSLIEYRIIQFLSLKPYKPFTPAEITAAVHTDANPVTVDALPEHIRTLRQKLGLFSDYVQSVPYIGYRFKP